MKKSELRQIIREEIQKLKEVNIPSNQVKEIKKLFKLGWSPEDIVDELFDGDDKYLKKVEKLDPQK